MALLYNIYFSEDPYFTESDCFDFDPLEGAYYSTLGSRLSDEDIDKSVYLTENPKWAEGDPEKVRQYYRDHQERRLDHALRSIACRLGIIVHGDMDQEQLSLHLKRFDIKKLFAEGPYKNAVLSIAAQQLIYDSLSHMDKVFDIHLHNLGYDEGNYLNPKTAALGVATWMDYFTFAVLRYASGMSSPIGSTHEARKRIHLYAQHFPKLCGIVLPIHKALLQDGKVDWKATGSFLKNRSAWLTATSFESSDSELLPAVSVHLFDLKWQEKLLKAHVAREAHQKNQTGEWTGKLFGDLAAVTTHYGPEFIQELLLHAYEEGIRLIYGSDYPYTNLIKPRNDAYEVCAKFGLLDSAIVKPLKEIRAWNPLLANFVFTRNLEYIDATGEKIRFPESTFTGIFMDAELNLKGP